MKINRKLLVRGKKFLALLLAVTMVTGMLPSSVAYAAENPAVNAEDVESVLSGDVTEGDVAAESVNEADTVAVDPVDGGAANGIELYAGETPELTQYTFDRTEFDEQYETVLPYGDFDISSWQNWVRNTVRVLEDGINRGSLQQAQTNRGIVSELQWQVQEESGWTDISAPTWYSAKVGNYKLIILIPAVQDVSAEAKYEMTFEITKAEVEPEVTIDPVMPGTKGENVKASSAYIRANNDTFNYRDDAAASDFTLTYSIKDAYTGAVVSGELLKTGDYIVEITPAFTDNVTKDQKDSYTLKPVIQKLQMAGLITPDLVVTMSDKWADKENAGTFLDYSVIYNGEAIAAPVAPTDYKLEVQYWDGTSRNDDGTRKYTQIAPAPEELTYEWRDASRLKMDSTPVNAGTYYYRITFTGRTGLYGSAYADIKVVVTPKKLTLVPKWKAETRPTFYPGMTMRDVLGAVTYVARDESNAEVAIDREHIWGDYRDSYYSDDEEYKYNGRTIPFEPVFKLQVETDETDADNKKLYADVSDPTLVYGKPYRVIFSGNKAVYWGDSSASASNTTSINNYNYNADRNYQVNIDRDVLELNVLTVDMAAGNVVTIDVSKIPALEGTQAAQAGTTYENPYVKVYDGKALYEERANYKQAEVKGASGVLASGIDQTISYTWYRQNGTRNELNSETGKYESVPTWTKVGAYNTIPSNAGNYKLEVSYADPTNVNHAVPVEVFYRIEKQKIKVVPKTAPVALTETAVNKYDFSQIEFVIQTVPAVGEGEVLAWTEGDADEVNESEKDFYIDWTVEKKAGSDEDFSAAYGNFTKGTSYRVAVASLNLRAGLRTNYTDFEYVTKGTGDAAVTTTEYLNETCAITLNDMGTTELKIEVDGNKLVGRKYDGTEYVIPEGAVKITKADGSAVSDVEPEYRWVYDKAYLDGKKFKWPIDGGHYTLYVSYSGNTTYKAVAEQLVGEFDITPKTLSVEAVVDTQIKAGSAIEDYDFPLTIDGVEDRDKDAFTWQTYGHYPAMNSFYHSVKDENGNAVSTYKGEKNYTVTVIASLTARYARNYVIESKGIKFATVRDNSTVSAAGYGSISMVALTDTVTGMEHVIKPEQGIDYINNYSLSNYDNKSVSGNYFAFSIRMPAEYDDVNAREIWNNAFFKNSIENVEKAGGYVLNYRDGSNLNARNIVVAFDASAKDKKEFQIRWEEGYIETFTVDFSAAVLGADLTKAVEPKSISFNSPTKKMVVGGEQALDVKLSKKLQNDVICLQYTVSDESVLCVDQNGYAVALDSGKADVTVTPVREDENGKLVPIEGAKSAKVTITVTDVTAPKIQKVVALHNSAKVTYGQVSDGYRREVYVLKGKGIKADAFETKIASMTNENWEGLFDVAPAYYHYSDWTVLEWRNKQAVYTIEGLEPNTDYTVYVRNVSQARTLTDGCKVTVSGKGNVKSFKTTRHQVEDLDIGFENGENKPVQYYKYDADEGYISTDAEGYHDGHFEVKLSAGSIKANTWGLFQQLPVYAAADTVDEIWVALPIKDAVQKKAYVAPKLVYQVAERVTYTPAVWYDHSDDYYYIPTPYASFDKSGKLKLSGVATVYVRVMDTTTGTVSDWRRLIITATPDSIVGKNITFEVGQTMNLTSLVDYKEGKLVLKGYFNKNIVYDQALREAVEASPYFEMNGDWGITAVKPGGSLTLTLKDLYVGADKTTNVTLKTKALAAATGLKASFLVDDRATMSFNYNGLAEKFKVEVTDGRGRIIESTLYNKSGFVDVTDKYVLGYDMSNYSSGNYYYRDAKGKNYYFFHVSGLAKLSKYNVTVTAIWQNDDSTICESSKPAKKAIKTTKMPASYSYLHKDGLNDSRGGVSISYYGRISSGGTIRDDSTTFSSGNTYELYYVGSGTQHYPKNMLSDTLTWTSSNKKVATIKANAGTYTATLKALKAGETVIEVKSKVTKKVIGRYKVYVSAVGTARYSYFGENEKQTFSLSSLSAKTYASMDSAAATAADYSVTTVIEGTGSGNTYTFTAPEDGTYSFWTAGSSNTCGTLFNSDGKVLTYADGGATDSNFKFSYKLAAGEQVSVNVREWTFGDFAATLNISAE